MLAQPTHLSPSATSVTANLRLSEAILLLAPASSMDESSRARTLNLLRTEPKPDDEAQADNLARLITSYERARLLTLEQKFDVLVELRGMLALASPAAPLLDSEIKNLTQVRDAIGALHDAFFRGSVTVLGVRKGSSQPHQRIPSTFFSQPQALLWRSNEIGQSGSVVDQMRAARGQKTSIRQGDEYTDVLLDGLSFERWRRGSVQPATAEAASKPRTQKNARSRNTAKLAIESLWPSGIPITLNAKERNDAIRTWCKDHGHREPSDSSIKRAINSLGNTACIS